MPIILLNFHNMNSRDYLRLVKENMFDHIFDTIKNYWKFEQAFISSGFPGGSDGKVSDCTAGDPGSIPGSGISPGGRNGNPLQYSCLENSMDRGAWWATVHGVAKSRTQLSDFTSLHFTSFHQKKFKPLYCMPSYIKCVQQVFGEWMNECAMHCVRYW